MYVTLRRFVSCSTSSDIFIFYNHNIHQLYKLGSCSSFVPFFNFFFRFLNIHCIYNDSSTPIFKISIFPRINHFISASRFLNVVFSGVDFSCTFNPHFLVVFISFSTSSKSYFFTLSGAATHPLTGFIYMSILLKLIFQLRFL